MLYWLLFLKLFHYFPPFRIFRYLTFRTAFASLTALFTGLIVGPMVFGQCEMPMEWRAFSSPQVFHFRCHGYCARCPVNFR